AAPKKAPALELPLDGETQDLEAPRVRRRETSLPPDHEVLPMEVGPGVPADPEVTAQAIRAAFEATQKFPVKGREVFGRSRIDLPQEGDADYERARQAQEAAEEVIRAAESLLQEQRAVDERIAQVYASEKSTGEDE
ncbi:MAG: hypothetical protein H6730_37340, partial [Deltaproteobacteria bacterium]|nr:hypothetical protein [Deltaproteobacteria bacterium]